MKRKSTDILVPSDCNYERDAPATSGVGECRLIICAVDYNNTISPLNSTEDGKQMQRLARSCGIRDVTTLYEEQCTIMNVRSVIWNVGLRCNDDDYFIFYFSGHGTRVEDESGDEENGYDEAFCCYDPSGKFLRQSFMIDDEFSDIVTRVLRKDVRVLIMADCCHSGTCADLDHPKWENRHAISISGCSDNQEADDTPRGGIFTMSLLLAVNQLQDVGEEEYSVGLLYNATLRNDAKIFNSEQDITINCTDYVTPDGMAWPLIPENSDYRAPLTKWHDNMNKAACDEIGIPFHVLKYVNKVRLRKRILKGDFDINELVVRAHMCGIM